jgi:hypothetical protein
VCRPGQERVPWKISCSDPHWDDGVGGGGGEWRLLVIRVEML